MQRSTLAALNAGAILVITGCGGGSGGSAPVSLPFHQHGPSAEYISTCDTAIAEMGMPFDYIADPVKGLWIAGDNNDYIPLIIGPWGAHASPHTGHPAGNGKADMMGVLAHTPAQFETFDGQACTDFDPESPNCGRPRDELLTTRPYYKVPDRFSLSTLEAMQQHGIGFTIDSIYVSAHGEVGSESWPYWDSPHNWEVHMSICGYGLGVGHMGKLSDLLKQRMLDAGADIDFDNFDGELYKNLIADLPPILIEPGDKFGYPQLVGQLVPANGDQLVDYVRPHKGGAPIWAQIEFLTVRYEQAGTGDGYTEPSYLLLSETEQALWEGIMHDEMDNPDSARYGTSYAQQREWTWRAEGNLIHTPRYQPDDLTNGLLRGLGDWWESYDGCQDDDILCDEVISFNRIDRDSPAFDESFYEPTSHYTLFWLRTGTTPFAGYWGEIITTSGDILNDETGLLLVLWRLQDGGAPVTYQKLAYQLDTESKTLKVAWGEMNISPEAISYPAYPTIEDTCDGITLTCHRGFNEHVKLSNIDGHL